MHRRCLLVVALAAAACTHRAEMPMFGHWNGGFVPVQGQSKWVGFLQFYATGSKFKIHVGTQNQSAEPTGTWEIRGRQLILTVTDLRLQMPTDAKTGAILPVEVSGDEVRASMGQTLVFNISQDMKTLTGVRTKLGSAEGAYVFRKNEQSTIP